MLDAKLDSWLDDNMRSGLSSWNSFTEPLDRNTAPKIASEIGEMNNTFNPIMGVLNGMSTLLLGQDLWGNQKEGVYERGIRPAISIISFGQAAKVNALTKRASDLDMIINTVETAERWQSGKKNLP